MITFRKKSVIFINPPPPCSLGPCYSSDVVGVTLYGDGDVTMSLWVRKPINLVLTRSDTKRAVQSQKMVRG